MALKGAGRKPSAAHDDISIALPALEHGVSENFFRNVRSSAHGPRLLAVPVHVYTQYPLCGEVGDSLDGAMDVSIGFGSGSGIDIFRE